MILKMIQSVLCVFLFVSHGVEGKVVEKVIKESESVKIVCEKDHSGTLFWLRQNGNGDGFEYVGTYSKTKKLGKVVDEHKFEVTEKYFNVKNFERQKDSGIYSCVFINNNELQFCGITELRGETVPTTVKPKVQTVPVQTVAVTTNPGPTCGQNGAPAGTRSKNLDVLLGCELRIFISLVAGCGILLLLLLLTILYCNHIRTRRCPHHYKKQPRSRPAGHKTLPNPPDY
ncbi:T-cell surface glycoprotein CD8 alpha chain [Clarias gariepinus]|uniref:T-cell surface glycoprotein CD8 alpha chain n=1 Tax=Clarias gariepinus TaxID=13013 RepID=UPI00234CC076|nr:T-cell surface glycoprotein CD8 alpha chain [Clarias gariepinus]